MGGLTHQDARASSGDVDPAGAALAPTPTPSPRSWGGSQDVPLALAARVPRKGLLLLHACAWGAMAAEGGAGVDNNHHLTGSRRWRGPPGLRPRPARLPGPGGQPASGPALSRVLCPRLGPVLGGQWPSFPSLTKQGLQVACSGSKNRVYIEVSSLEGKL